MKKIVVILVILIFSAYYVGKKLKNNEFGLLTALFVSFIPGIYNFSRVPMPDFALTSLLVLSICLMLYTNKFKNKKITLLFGLSCGIGMLTKWTFVTYIIAPFTIYFFHSFTIRKLYNKRIKNLLIGLLIGVLICLTWYFNKISFILERGINLNEDFAIELGEYNAYSFDNLKYYHTKFHPVLIGYLMPILIIFVIVFTLIKSKHKLIFLSWIFIPYVFLSLAPWKNPRYILPILPSYGIMFTTVLYIFIKKINKKIIKIIIFILVTVFLIVSFYNNMSTSVLTSSHNLFYYGLPHPYNSDFRIQEIVSTITNQSNNTGKIMIIPNSEQFDALYHEFLYNKYDYKIDRGIFCIGSGGRSNCNQINYKDYIDKKYVCSQDFVIDYEGAFDYIKYNVIYLPPESKIHNVITQFIAFWKSCKSNYVIINKLSYPSNQTILIYKEINQDT